MAMIECRECREKISDQALGCPKCGAPLPTKAIAEKFSSAKSNRLAGTAFFGGLLWLFFAMQAGGKDALENAWGGARWPIIGGALLYVVNEIDRNLKERKQKKLKKAENN